MQGHISDYLVIGSGIAGLSFALKVADTGTVTILTKDRLPESSSQYAQGGIASVWGPGDSFAAHTADTLRTGAGLCHVPAVDTLVREGPDRIRELMRPLIRVPMPRTAPWISGARAGTRTVVSSTPRTRRGARSSER
jgi:aspartate oxidase